MIAAALRTNLGDRLSALGTATLAALIATPVLFVIYNFVSASQYFPILSRNALAAFPAIDVASANAQIDTTALASVISTTDDVQEIDGQRVQVVVGRPVGAKKQAKFFVGNVPIKPPRPDAWEAPFLNVPLFEPPAIDPSPVDGIAHINLDFALEFLLGDRLR